MVIAKERPRTPLDYVAAGVAMQRLWLCAGTLGLHAQPQMTPLIFRWYVRAGRRFSASAEISRAAAAVADRFEAVAHLPHDRVVFFCRVGRSKPPTSRSLRLDLNDLLIA
jgi:hypothetical protein